ncbi:hypothetical protein [Rhodococcus sp. UNC363MFTsu5.1]|uniref:hypothetical protein n=1 Tax=Rhodococcus sp. UNC363MFTsu5.1 TaxID=1449069 RepID=UPI00048103CD|nr:hypothetical protein [Rhodococcus sp. UNC363MFTsu5.1]
MTNDNFTAEEYRTAQRVLASDRTRGDLAGIAVWCGQQADRLDAAEARDTEAEQLARVMCNDSFDFDTAWDEVNDATRRKYLRYSASALDHLASRLAPDNGITLTADEAADLREVLRWCGRRNNPGAEQEFCVNQAARLRARFAPTEQAEPKPIGWYRTMDPDFATKHFGFPTPVAARWTASDGGAWAWCEMPGYWELREYGTPEVAGGVL